MTNRRRSVRSGMLHDRPGQSGEVASDQGRQAEVAIVVIAAEPLRDEIPD